MQRRERSQVKDVFFLTRVFAGLHAGRRNTLTAFRQLVSEENLGQNYFRYKGKMICIYLNSPQQTSSNPRNFTEIKDIVEERIDEAERKGAVAIIMALQPRGLELPVEYFRQRYKEHLHLAYLRVDFSRELDDLMKKMQAAIINRIVDRPHETAKALWGEWGPFFDAL